MKNGTCKVVRVTEIENSQYDLSESFLKNDNDDESTVLALGFVLAIL